MVIKLEVGKILDGRPRELTRDLFAIANLLVYMDFTIIVYFVLLPLVILL